MEKLEPEEEVEELVIEEKEDEQQEVTMGEHVKDREGEVGKLLTGVDAERGASLGLHKVEQLLERKEEVAEKGNRLSIPKHEIDSLGE